MENLILILFFIGFILWAWALYDIIKTNAQSPGYWFLWFWIILIMPIVGPIIYFGVKRKMNPSPRKFFLGKPQLNDVR